MPSGAGTRGLTPSGVPREVLFVCQRLAEAGHEAYVVGGCVRDALRGRPAKDWDVATSARPGEVQRLFRRTVPTGIKHGTVTVLTRGQSVEVTTFRGEGAYSDARHPDTVFFGVSLEEDLARRDFTINAMAFDPVRDRLVDPFGGQADVAARRVRAVRDPAERFREDGLRVLRAVRFAATLEFELDAATEAAIPAALQSLGKISAERVRDELLKLLGARRPSVGLRAAERTGILRVVLPELAAQVGMAQNRFHKHDVWEHTLATVDAIDADPIRRLAALLHDMGKPRAAAPRPESPEEMTFYRHEAIGAAMADEVLRRLKLPNQVRERVVALVAHHMFYYAPEWSDASVRRFIQRVGRELLGDLFALRAADIAARGKGEDADKEIGELARRIERVIAEEQAITIGDLSVDGKDVMAILRIPPGPQVGEILRRLLERVLDDPSLNQRETLLDLIPQVAAG